MLGSAAMARWLVLLMLVPLGAARGDPRCTRLGGASGVTVVLLTHAGADPEGDVAAARRALEGAPFAAAGLQLYAAALAPGDCERVTKDSLVPFLRCSARLNELLAACGAAHPKAVVLSGLSFTSRGEVAAPGATAGVFVSTAAPAAAWTADLLHELGHAFGLRDERPLLTSRARSLAATPGPNCAATEAEARRRWGDLAARGEAGFHRGCAGHADWLRPDERTLMDAPRQSGAFGASSSRYLRDAARCCFTADRAGCEAAAGRHPELAACLGRASP